MDFDIRTKGLIPTHISVYGHCLYLLSLTTAKLQERAETAAFSVKHMNSSSCSAAKVICHYLISVYLCCFSIFLFPRSSQLALELSLV
jgi:hypothetical protein